MEMIEKKLYNRFNGPFKVMRNSPISHIRSRDHTSSPYNSTLRNQSYQSPARGINYSPERNPSTADAEYWRRKAQQLEKELLGLNEEISFLQSKAYNLEDLENKIEVLIAQNTHFVDENESLIHLVQRKNAELEEWKKKFDSCYHNSSIAESEKKKIYEHLNIRDQENQIQIDKLLAEISRLQDQLAEMETLRQIEINTLKNKYENEAMSQIQNLKRSQYGNTELQELNIRKLKDEIEERKFQIQNLRRQSKLENERLNGQISFLKNEISKLESQKEHEIDLIKTEHENTKNNLLRQYRKNQDQLKNLHQAKVKRLSFEIEEKKNEIEQTQGKLKKSGKENEIELNIMAGQEAKMRVELKDNDNRNLQRLKELTTYYDNQLQQERLATRKRQKNLQTFYDGELNSLKEVIAAKQAQIKRLLALNAFLKENEQKRLADITLNNKELKDKIREIIMHYQREVELMKIKITQLYEADLQSLRSQMRNSYAAYNRQTDNLRDILKNLKVTLAKEIQDRLDLRKDYETRLTEFKVKYEREHQQLHDLIAMHEKQIDVHTSKISLTHIEHNDKLQQQSQTLKESVNERRSLELQIQNKNKEIEALNLRIQKLEGLQKRELEKMESELKKLKGEHQKWIDQQNIEAGQWNNERSELKENLHNLNIKLQQEKEKDKQEQQKLLKQIEDLRLKIAGLQGQIIEYQNKVGHLNSKNQVEVQNVEKTYLETQSLMNNQKDKHFAASKKEKELLNQQNQKKRGELDQQIQDLKAQNQRLRDNFEKGKIREEELKGQIATLLDSVNNRNKLEQHVINIGLSNNYFKNVAEIFKKTIDH